MGDPAGIGIEITLAAWLRRAELALPPFILFGDPECVAARAAALGFQVPLEILNDPGATAAFAESLPILPVRLSRPAVAGQPDRAHAPAIIGAIEQAVTAVHQGKASGVVTNPISKKPLLDSGFAHPGHTEFLGELALRLTGVASHPVMMLASDLLRVVPVTVHIPLAEVPRQLTTALIIETARITERALRLDFGIARPRLAFTGLNPHAGEGGALGHEDAEVIVPAIIELQRQGFSVSGPYPADTLFHAAARARYDAALAMYHDQALLPLKTLSFDDGVNVTLGLPFVRTSPDHGTAFDIAGSGRASPESLIAALRLADQLARNRAARP